MYYFTTLHEAGGILFHQKPPLMTTSHELPRQYGSLLDLSGRTRRPARRIVAVCTGRGMKAPDTITRAMPCPTGIPARLEALEVVS